MIPSPTPSSGERESVARVVVRHGTAETRGENRLPLWKSRIGFP